MRQVNMHEAKTHLSRLVECVAHGDEIVIAKSGKPVAKLVRYREDTQPRLPGSMRGQIWVDDDFDAPLPPEILAEFYDGDVEPRRYCWIRRPSSGGSPTTRVSARRRAARLQTGTTRST